MKLLRCWLSLLIGTGVIISFSAGCYRTMGGKTFDGATAQGWSVRLADSEIARRGTNQGWNYETGLFTWSLLELSKGHSGTPYETYVQTVIDNLIADDGAISGYVASSFKLDNIMTGRSVIELHQRTGLSKYRNAAARLREQLSNHPRTSEGGFWHKQVYPHQMWLDGLYMAMPFYAQYGAIYHEPSVFDDVLHQFLLMDRHAYHPQSQLWFHGWDEKKLQAWANQSQGTSPSFWGRAIGWFAMALVDTLDYLPEGHPHRKELLEILNRFAQSALRYQDPVTGTWYQVVDQGNRSGNYLEASASSMFTYTLAKGMNRGYLNVNVYKQAALRAFAGLVRQFIRKAAAVDQFELIEICSVASLRAPNSGTFDYYISEPKVKNDLKGIGSFILAGKEIDILVNGY